MRARPGHVLVLGYEGVEPPPELFAFARTWGLGGVILFGRNAPDAGAVRRATAALRQGLADADPASPALVLVDQEGGRVERIRRGVPRLPPARQLAREGPSGVEARVGAQARALKALGIDVNLAPVCDVIQEGESGVIGDRAFGSDPQEVARLAAAHVRGCLGAGVLACAKHFPGHGAARVDSHVALPRVERGLADLAARDLVPFRAAVEAGVPLVMAAHLVVPPVDTEPASLSPFWLGPVLRDRLGFRGAVISDDMEMGALHGLGDPAGVASRAVAAGCDLLIYGRLLRPDLPVEAVARSIARDVPRARLDEARARAAALRELAG